MADLATLQTRLVEAENAYHTLVMGTGVATVVDQNGERVEYNKANIGALRNYIATLKFEIGALTGNAITDGSFRPIF